jgi:hypothetical protein
MNKGGLRMLEHPRPGSAVEESFVKYSCLNGRYARNSTRAPPFPQAQN